uniref:Uncharacterized protein n=1 Tax=Sinocyclocheilus anshuiensis TaxID=1608454 RepID=A0A671NKA6_9TELE
MAEARFSQDELTCPLCLDLLKDPVSIQCGHSYCKSCITGCWDQEDQMRVYSCPQCRQTFSPRPTLARNTMLTDLVEKLKKTKLPADCYAGAGDVQCDVCTGRKYKAVKSCLVCQESYCQTHFDRHEELHSHKPHKVIDATGLQEMICQKHEKHLEMYCMTDQQCICKLCTKYEHKNHNTVSAAAQRIEKQVYKTISKVNTQCSDPIVHLFSLIDKLEDFCKEELKKISDRGKVLEIHLLSETSPSSSHIMENSHQLTLDTNTAHKRLRLSESNRVITGTNTDQPYPDHPGRFDFWSQVLCSECVCGRCYWELEWNGGEPGVRISVSYKSISRKGQSKACLFGNNDQSWSLQCNPSRYLFRHNNVVTDLPVESISSRIGVFVDHSAGTLSFYSVSDTMSLIHTVQTTFTQPLYPGFLPLYPGFGVYKESSVKLC